MTCSFRVRIRILPREVGYLLFFSQTFDLLLINSRYLLFEVSEAVVQRSSCPEVFCTKGVLKNIVDCFCTSDGCFCIFFKKYYLTAILQSCCDVLIIFFFSTHCLMYKKSNLFVYKFLVNCQIF